jgi:hypothetical protein
MDPGVCHPYLQKKIFEIEFLKLEKIFEIEFLKLEKIFEMKCPGHAPLSDPGSDSIDVNCFFAYFLGFYAFCLCIYSLGQ